MFSFTGVNCDENCLHQDLQEELKMCVYEQRIRDCLTLQEEPLNQFLYTHCMF